MLYRGISVRQPFAHLILEGVKDVENRHYAFPVETTTTLLIHASKSTEDCDEVFWGPETLRALLKMGLAKMGRKGLATLWRPTFGMVVGAVDVVAVKPNGKSKSKWAVEDAYEERTHHWEFQNPRRLVTPFAWAGQTSLLNITPPQPLKFK